MDNENNLEPNIEENVTVEPEVAQAMTPKKGPGLLIGIICAAIVIVGAASFALVKAGVFASKEEKIRDAIEETLEYDELFKALDVADIVDDGNFTLGINGNVSGSTATIEFQTNLKRGQQQCKANANIGGVALELTEYFDDEKVMLSVPALYSKAVAYDYTKESTGYVKSVDNGNVLKVINDSLTYVSDSMKDYRDKKDTYIDFLVDHFDSLDFKSVDKKEFTIDGDSKDCSGYTAKLDKAFVVTFMKDLKALLSKEIETQAGLLESAGITKESVLSEYDNLITQLDGMQDFSADFTFYLSGGKLANVTVKADTTEVAIDFQGGDTRIQNMKLSITNEGSEIGSIVKTGVIKDDVETVNIAINDAGSASTQSFGWTYNLESGKVDFMADGASMSDYVDMSIENTGDGVKVNVNSINVEGVSANGSLSIARGTSIEEISGDVLLINDASEADLQALLQQIQQSPIVSALSQLGESVTDSLGTDTSTDYDDYDDYGDLDSYDDLDTVY